MAGNDDVIQAALDLTCRIIAMQTWPDGTMDLEKEDDGESEEPG